LHVGAGLDGESVDDAVEGSAHAGFLEGVLGGFVGGLRLGCLRLNSSYLGLRVAVFLFFARAEWCRPGRAAMRLRPA
jgi:hypothetical protein